MACAGVIRKYTKESAAAEDYRRHLPVLTRHPGKIIGSGANQIPRFLVIFAEYSQA
jgi:hypothetical protein